MFRDSPAIDAPALGASEFQLGGLLLKIAANPSQDIAGLEMIPSGCEDQVVQHRLSLTGGHEVDRHPRPEIFPDPWEAEPLVQLKWRDDAPPSGFAAGHTLRDAPSTARLKFLRQSVTRSAGKTVIQTELVDEGKARVQHYVGWHPDSAYVEVWSEVTNISPTDQILEFLTSFTLGRITPFHHSDAPGRLFMHRFRSNWCAEGRIETSSVESLGLERSWAGFATMNEKFGQTGSMPVRRFFPFVAIEDRKAGVVWAASLACGGSWQIEASRRGDGLCLSGGLADADSGQWSKTLEPGESLVSPKAFLTVVKGDLNDACHALLQSYDAGLEDQPGAEEQGGIIFNEWCQTWGDPSQERIDKTLTRLKGSQVRYFVIDAGWFVPAKGSLSGAHGDWRPDADRFPNGMEGVAKSIRSAGLIPGLWFEMETCGNQSDLYNRTELLLRRNGQPLTIGIRRFLDLSEEAGQEYLAEKVIANLKKWGFGYLKVDYNESTGAGMDGCESPGEKLRMVIEGAYRLFDRIRREIPDLVIENCASGGHRLAHGFVNRTSMSSFSDAHETIEIPLIAASVQLLIPPAKSQIWAVLHASDSRQRLAYSLTATFLGRMCLSGPVDQLTDRNWEFVCEAMASYQAAWPVIRRGHSRRYGNKQESLRHPTGWQAVVRESLDDSHCLVVIHTFRNAPDHEITLPLPSGSWRAANIFSHEKPVYSIADRQLQVAMPGDFCGVVLLLER